MLTDLEVVVDNMLRGPAGLLRDAKFFADARALAASEKQSPSGQPNGQGALFPSAPSPTLGGAAAYLEKAAAGNKLFGNFKPPWE